MPMHDWTREGACIFPSFHHGWISALSDTLNRGLLPGDYYALAEQQAAGFGPDVLTLQETNGEVEGRGPGEEQPSAKGLLVAAPKVHFQAESAHEFFRRKKSTITVRHVSGDRIVAMVEIVSPGNKATQYAFQAFINKACELLEYRIHLLIIDPFPPGPRDPNGVHAAIWQEVQEDAFQLPADKPLTLVAYECDLTTRAYIEPVAVGDVLPQMPLFLEPHGYVPVPLETTYQTAYAVLPRRWQRVLEVPPPGTAG